MVTMEEENSYKVSGCCSAKTWTNIIGMLYGIVAFYLLIFSADYSVEVFNLSNSEDVKHFLEMMGMADIAKYNVLGIKALKVVFVVAAVINGITYVASAMVVIGVNNNDRRLLLPWILHSILLLGLFIILTLLTMAVVIAIHGVMGFAAAVGPAVAVVVLWALFIVVVNRHYSDLNHFPHPLDDLANNRVSRETTGTTPVSQGLSYLHSLEPRVKDTTDN